MAFGEVGRHERPPVDADERTREVEHDRDAPRAPSADRDRGTTRRRGGRSRPRCSRRTPSTVCRSAASSRPGTRKSATCAIRTTPYATANVRPRSPNDSGSASAATTSARHRREHHDPHRAFFGIDDARQPRVARPRPPEQRERQQPRARPSHDPSVAIERGALREPEHEDQVEEQLERLDRVALPRLGVQAQVVTSAGEARPSHDAPLSIATNTIRWPSAELATRDQLDRVLHADHAEVTAAPIDAVVHRVAEQLLREPRQRLHVRRRDRQVVVLLGAQPPRQ